MEDGDRRMVEEVGVALKKLPWCGGISSFPKHMEITDLWRFLGPRWLSNENEDVLMHLLRYELDSAGCTGVELANESGLFAKKLIQAYHTHKTATDQADTYAYSRGFQWIRKIGHALAMHKCRHLAALANLTENHWIAILVDVDKHTIRYGDSMGSWCNMDAELKAALRWWTQFHTGYDFTITDLPITEQPAGDGYPCGLLSWNALEAYLLGNPDLLVDKRKLMIERFCAFLRVINIHNDQVSISSVILLKVAHLTSVISNHQ
ncbi:hypothetical protein K435DRAFT_695695 [Dendrothele bispora CBS 962.96]|uniref:Ubiquitin-like protease family profile domain-containing protein n=1 Tax=Dendrothele bispora (strain CBS 962.96) TaxID=1314807 RepID=A0A4S8KWV9_DENBC|nr:hypothetical protein K435DRAFT_695695 [Dendrothele bispora CBS 962.96]